VINYTPRELAIARAGDGPATGINLALAELSLYWDNHRKNAPDVPELRINIRVTDEGSPADRLATLKDIADWLGVPVTERHGVHHVQRRFGTGDDSIILEAHYTPDPDATHALIREAVKRREVAPEAEAAAELEMAS
jgi:hypothetical protein